MNTRQPIINFLEIIARAIISIICVSMPMMIFNAFYYKSIALVVFILLSAVVAEALYLFIRRRRIATSEDELEVMFPNSEKLSKNGSKFKMAATLTLVVLFCVNCWCGVKLISEYKGVDEQLAEGYEITEDAIAVMRSIPGTFAVRVYYVVTTPMSDFDYEYYDSLVMLDYLVILLSVSYGILETEANTAKRYNISLRSMEDANY